MKDKRFTMFILPYFKKGIFNMKKLLVMALMLSLVGCSKKEEQPSQTYESIGAIKPTETQPIETPEIKETVEALVIEKTQFETAPMDSIEVIGVDENGNMQYIYNDVKVSDNASDNASDNTSDNASDNESNDTNSEQDYDDIASKKYLVTENDDSITISEVEETESQESLFDFGKAPSVKNTKHVENGKVTFENNNSSNQSNTDMVGATYGESVGETMSVEDSSTPKQGEHKYINGVLHYYDEIFGWVDATHTNGYGSNGGARWN